MQSAGEIRPDHTSNTNLEDRVNLRHAMASNLSGPRRR